MTPATLVDQPWLKSAATRAVLAAITAKGGKARFVGGCVRDSLLGRAADDIDLDIATTERPERVIRLLEAAGIRALPTGLAHGTITAVRNGRHFEITTLRRDVACDGRHAEVEFTDDFDEDAARRDFTINAMSCDPDGRLHDPFGGLADLEAGRVRFVGDPTRRIEEDHLRILRFFRFHAHFGRGEPDAAAIAACRQASPCMADLSGERLQKELLRLLEAPDPVPCVRWMIRTGVMAAIVAGPLALDRLAHVVEGPPGSPLLRLAALVRPPPADASAASRTSDRLRLSRSDAEQLRALASLPLPTVTDGPARQRRDLYRLGADLYRDLVLLARAGQPADAADWDRILVRIAAWKPPEFPVKGADVLAQGLAPGPRVGEILRQVESWWISEDFRPTRQACLQEIARRIADEAGPAGAS